jgi:RHS repeat-associated protein
MAKPNPFRFSTKYQDDEADMLYYGYRYYNANVGRWLSCDPIGDEAFFQIYTTSWSWRKRQRARLETLKPGYVFLANDSIDSIDALGLLRFDSKCSPSDIEKMKKELKDRCQKAKAGARMLQQIRIVRIEQCADGRGLARFISVWILCKIRLLTAVSRDALCSTKLLMMSGV